MDDNLHKFAAHLRATQVKALFPEQRTHILQVNSTATIAEVYKILTEHKILSVPVLDKSLAKPRFTAFIDVIDILVHVMSKISPSDVIGGETPKIFTQFTAGQVVGLSERNPYFPVEESAPLMVALELMVKWRVHRIPVVDAEGHLETLITQSHVIKYIHDHLYLLKRMKSKTVEDLDLGTKGVITIHSHASVLDGFRLMSEKKLSAVGIVDDHGILIGNLSASDIKTLGFDASFIAKLYLPVSEYLKAIRGEFFSKGNVVTVQSQHSFEHVMDLLTKKNIHRVYVVDFEGKPLRIITLTDILSCLFEY